jgi:phosphoadenosine phosphosulfate reductase
MSSALAQILNPTDNDLLRLNRQFETATAHEIIAWASESFGPFLALTASMTDAVMVDLSVAVDPAIEVVFIDTGYHFPETLETVEKVRRHYGLNLKMMTVAPHNEKLWIVNPTDCCTAVKVGQLDRALASKSAWMSGLRRAEAESRTGAPIVGRDLRGLIKVNPIANWSDQDVADYITDNNIIVNPLIAQGYPSIGCWPCTKPVVDGEDPRSGRWNGEKTECGLHL